MGIPDINVAGMLANFQAESYLDSSTVEGVWDELFMIGGKKQQFNQNPTAFFHDFVVDKWAQQGVTLNTVAYKASDGNYYPGVGLGAWTGENCRKLISKANELGLDWWDFDFQLAYAISNQYRDGVVRGWTEPAVSLDESAFWFMENFEGYSRNWSPLAHKRLQYTPVFYDMIVGENWSQQVDEEYAKKIIALADSMDGTNTLEELQQDKIAKHVLESTTKILVQFLDLTK